MLLAMTAPDSLRSMDHTRPYRDSIMSYNSGSSGLVHSISLADMPTSQRQRTVSGNMGADWAGTGNAQLIRRSYSMTANNAPFRRPKSQSVTLAGSNPVSRSNSFNAPPPLTVRGSMTQMKSDTITTISEVPDFADMGIDLGLDELFKVLGCGPGQAGGLPPAAEMLYSSNNNGPIESSVAQTADFSVSSRSGVSASNHDIVPQQPSFATSPRPFTSYSMIELIPAGRDMSGAGHHMGMGHNHLQQQRSALQYTMDVMAFAATSGGSQQFSPESVMAEPWEMDATTLQMGTTFSPFVTTQQQPPTVGGTRSVPDMMDSSFFAVGRDLNLPVADTLAGASQLNAQTGANEAMCHPTPVSRTVSPDMDGFSNSVSRVTSSVPRHNSAANRMSMDQFGTTNTSSSVSNNASNSMAALDVQRRQSEHAANMVKNNTQLSHQQQHRHHQQQQHTVTPAATLAPRTPSPGVFRPRAHTYTAGHVSPPTVSQLSHASPPPTASHPSQSTPAHTPGPRMLLPAQPLPVVKEMDNSWRRKRQRRSASQLLRNHACPVYGCEKRYEVCLHFSFRIGYVLLFWFFLFVYI